MTRKQITVGASLIIVALFALYFIGQLAFSTWRESEIQPPNTVDNKAEFPNKRNTSSFWLDAKSNLPVPSNNNSEMPVIWTCPMHPEISQDHPGTCPICGMKLVGSRHEESHHHGIHIDNATVQRLGVRLANIKKGVISQGILTYGNIVADETTVYSVQPRYEGWIKKLYIHSVGETVKAGQILYEIYSPELIIRQRTYLSSNENRKQLLQTLKTAPDTENEYVMDLVMDAAKDRARLHQEDGVSVDSIQEIENNKQATDIVKIVAEHSGVVSQINVKEGSMVSVSSVLMMLTNTAQIWIDVPLYPDQAESVHVGDSVTVSAIGVPPIKARVDFISPLAESNKVHARIQLNNRKFHLRPGAFVNVSIHTQSRESLILPRSAIIYTAQGNMAVLSRGDGHFLPVHVETGAEEGDFVELVDGLHEGAEVVVNGQFLIDAASSMSAATERLSMQKP